MTIHKCDVCDKEFTRACHLEKHKKRTKPCYPGEHSGVEKRFECEKCDKKFGHQSNLCQHRKTCTGPKMSREQQLQMQIDELNRKIQAMPEPIEETPLVLTSVGTASASEAQIYFGGPGDLLVPEEEVFGALVKFGESDAMPARKKKHERDFNGFEMLDSVVTSNPRAVESKLKDYLTVNHKLVKCKSVKKKYRDTEVFVARSQDEYAQIVRQTQLIAKEYEKQMVGLTERQQQVLRQQRLLDIEAMKLELQLIEARSNSA